MAQGVRLSESQVETIRAAWLLTENGSEAARRAGCSTNCANRFIREHRDELIQLRQEKTPELVEVIRALLDRTLATAFESRKLTEATFGQLLTGVGILIDKHQLLSGKATTRSETGVFEPDRLSPDQQETLATLVDIGARRGAA